MDSTMPADNTELADAITAWLAQHLARSGAQRFVVGLSGGVDSAVVCALCCRAVGADRVVTAIMPSHSHPGDAEHARLVAATFGVRPYEIDLTEVTDRFLAAMPAVPNLAESARRLAVANVRARLRMTTLYYLANLHQGLVVGTGNKSEAMVGYFTKWGDGGVDLLPLADLFKDEVQQLGRILGVPEAVLTRPPSAGLWHGQTDEDELGMSYDQLNAALRAILANPDERPADPVQARVWQLYQDSAHKRLPVPAFRKAARSAQPPHDSL